MSSRDVPLPGKQRLVSAVSVGELWGESGHWRHIQRRQPPHRWRPPPFPLGWLSTWKLLSPIPLSAPALTATERRPNGTRPLHQLSLTALRLTGSGGTPQGTEAHTTSTYCLPGVAAAITPPPAGLNKIKEPPQHVEAMHPPNLALATTSIRGDYIEANATWAPTHGHQLQNPCAGRKVHMDIKRALPRRFLLRPPISSRHRR
jgi:hypothetical protein